jgi:hypothetical protein
MIFRHLHDTGERLPVPADAMDRIERDTRVRMVTEHTPLSRPVTRISENDERPDDGDSSEGERPQLPAVVSDAPGGPVKVGRHDVLGRWPALEAAAQFLFEVPVRAVWRIVHFREAGNTGKLGGMVQRSKRGLLHVMINVAGHPNCPVRLLHTLRHELAHVENGDLDSGSPMAWDQHSEANCNGVADKAVVHQVLPLVETKAGVKVDGDVCLECCRDWRSTCGQPPEIFEAISHPLKVYTR